MRRILCLMAAVAIGGNAIAQSPNPGSSLKDVPEGNPPRLPLYAGPQPQLSPKEQKAVSIGKEWAGNRDKPARGDEGATVFVFGSTLPTIVCAPLYVCDLALQEGESVNDLNVGDSVRWKITPAAQGSGDSVITHVMIKPTDVGLITNLVITTNRRTYILKLVSRAQDWMPRAAFEYPDDVDAQWKAFKTRVEDQQALVKTAISVSAPAKLDFDYIVEGDAPWKPLRVYTDGLKTYIQFPSNVGSTELPSLVEIGEDTSFLHMDTIFNGEATHLVNYRFVDHRFEVDKVLTKAKLNLGVGNNAVTISITRWSKG